MAAVQGETRDRSRGLDRRARLDATGYHAVRFLIVDTDDPEEAVIATGLPAYGDPHPLLPDCFVRQIEPAQSFGGPANGWSEVMVVYDAPTPGGGGDSAVAGDASAFFGQSVTQQPVRFDIVSAPIPETQREVNVTELGVRAYTGAVTVKLAAWALQQNRVNSNSVTFPDFEGLPGSGLVVPARQLLARTVSFRPVRLGVAEVTYTFGYGPTGSFDYVFQPEDENGAALGPVQTKKIYPETAFLGAGVLW